MRRFVVVLIAVMAFAPAAGAQSKLPPGAPPWIDTTGEPGLYPNGDAVGVYRAALDLLYNDGGKRPSIIVMHDTVEGVSEGPCPVKCDRVWPHKSRIDTATILGFARYSPKRPRIRDFAYPIPIQLVSYDDVELMRHDGLGYLATHKSPSNPDGSELRVEFQRRYPGAWGLTTMSKVGFNPGHTEALVQIHHWCGESCASSEVLFLKRIDDQWRVIERIPSYVEARVARGNLRYRGPAGGGPTESEIVFAGPGAGKRSDAADAGAVYRVVLDSLYNFQGATAKTIVLTDRYWAPSDTLHLSRTRVDRDLLQKHAFLSSLHSLPDIPIESRKQIVLLPADSLDSLERAGAPLARQSHVDQPMWLAFMKRYPGAWGMTGLSRVAFDAAHERAMVYSDHECGPYCGNSDTWILGRHGDRWQILERIQRPRQSEWDPVFYPLRYLGGDAKPNSYRKRNVSALFVNAITKMPVAFTSVMTRGVGVPPRVVTTDSNGRIRLGVVPFTGVVEMKIPCATELSPDSVEFPEFVFSPGSDTTLTMSADFRKCLSPLPWEPRPRVFTGAQALITENEARFIFPRRGPVYQWDVPIKGTHPGSPEYMWEVTWPIPDNVDRPFKLSLTTGWKTGGPRQGSLAQLIAGGRLESMILCNSCSETVYFADPETDRKNIFASVEDGRLVFTIRGRDAVRGIFPTIPTAVRFETRVRQVPQPEYGPGDNGEGQNVFVNCHSSDSTAATRRRCNVPTESARRQQLARPTTPREVRVVAASYDGGTIMRNIDVRIRSEDLKTPTLTRSTGATGTFHLPRLPYDSVAFEALCARSKQVSGSLALFIAPGNDTTVQLLVDPRRCR